ncbi:MAG: hypothetical protein U1D28_15110 [Burkholderiales bacterium]|nr:hypothetical protein [Burkholderiales bacterium]
MKEKACWITPVSDCVGLMTVTMPIENTLRSGQPAHAGLPALYPVDHVGCGHGSGNAVALSQIAAQ